MVQPTRTLILLATLAIFGQVILMASAWLLPAFSEYRLIGDYISELVLGRYGYIQTSAMLLSGIGTIGLAYAIRRLTGELRGSLAGSVLVAVYGVGAVVSALFPTDRVDSPADVWAQSTTGIVHSMTALVSFVAMIVGMFVLSRTFARGTRWRTLTIWSVLLAASTLSLFFAQQEGPGVGLMQRLMVAAVSAWLIVVALRVRSIAGSGVTGASRAERVRD
jgi:hypothetical protein